MSQFIKLDLTVYYNNDNTLFIGGIIMDQIFIQVVDKAYIDILNHIFGEGNKMIPTYHTLFLVIFLIAFSTKCISFLVKDHHIIAKVLLYIIYFAIIIIDVRLILGV